jgi:glycosyltransferase involved in cell wall biosynthesis
MAEKQRVIYATSGWCIHDTRWFAALQDNGLNPIAMSVTDDPALLPEGSRAFRSAEYLRNGVDELLEAHPIPILAGPLTTITRHLVGANTRIVGLSWGWDLQPEAIGGELDADELAWVSDLDALIVDSIVTEHVAINLGVDPARISNIPWGIDVDLFTPDGPKADLSGYGVSAGNKVVLSLRSHTPIHRVGDIIEAFAIAVREDPSLFLLVGSDGPLLDDNIRRVEQLGISARVQFIGMLPEHELPALLRAADLYVSASAVDGTSVTLLQALATATPVVASAIPGNLAWLQPPSCIAVSVGDHRGLVGALATKRKGSIRAQGARLVASRVRATSDWRTGASLLPSILIGSRRGNVSRMPDYGS